MKTGFNLLLWTTHLDEAHLGVCEELKAADYDGVEVPVFHGTPEHYGRLGRRLDDIGLARTVVGIVQEEAANPMSGEPAHRAAGVAYLKWLVDCSAALGAEVLCGPFYQPLGVFSGRGATEEEWGRMVEAHRAMADHAAGRGLTIAVEPLNRFECYALNTLADAARLVDEVGADHYGLLYDTFHANIEEKDPAGAIAGAGGPDRPCPHQRERPGHARARACRFRGRLRGAEGGGLRRLADGRELRARTPGHRGGDEDLAAGGGVERGGVHRGPRADAPGLGGVTAMAGPRRTRACRGRGGGPSAAEHLRI